MEDRRTRGQRGQCELRAVVVVRADDGSFIAQQMFRGTQFTPALLDGEGCPGCSRSLVDLLEYGSRDGRTVMI